MIATALFDRSGARGWPLSGGRSWAPLCAALLLCAVLERPALGQEEAQVLSRAHAHNDYLHPLPLRDALDHGFNSVEADVHLVGDELLVAHDLEEVDSARTLEALYLAPLRERVTRHGGTVHASSAEPLLLLIDIKGDAEATYARLHPLLRRYADVLTITVGDQVVDGPVVAVISGNRPRSALLAAPVRFASFDGRLADLEEATLPPSFMPLVSEDWRQVTDWSGEGTPPPGLRAELEALVARAESQGRRLRLWGSPDRPEVWRVLRDTGVHLINTDDLDGLRDFLSTPRVSER